MDENNKNLEILPGIDNNFFKYLKRKWWIFLITLILIFLTFKITFYFAPFILFFLIAYFQSSYENNLFKSFASANNFNYIKKGNPGPQSGVIFNLGHSQKYNDLVIGNFLNRPFNLFMYQYTIGSGRNSQTYNDVTMTCNFNINLPAFVFRKRQFTTLLENEGESLKPSGYTQQVQLEGDFGNQFRVFIKPNTQDDVLSILSPDLMEIMKSLDKYELELNESGILYVYYHNFINDSSSLVNLFSIVKQVASNINKYANRQALIKSNSIEAVQSV